MGQAAAWTVRSLHGNSRSPVNTRFHLPLIVTVALSLMFCALPVQAEQPAPASVQDAMQHIKEQGMTEQAMDYQQQFLGSIAGDLKTAVEQGAAAKGKSDFDLLFVVGLDGRIKNAILTEPEKQPLGKYVAAKLLGVQAAKPPKDNWVIYLSQERK